MAHKQLYDFQMHALVFVEDPGAVNGVLPIARLLVSKGHQVSIQLEGYASSLKPSDLVGLTVVSDPMVGLMEGVFSLLLTGTSENLNSKSFELIRYCRQVSIVSVGFIDSPANPEHRFSSGSSNPLCYVPDYLIVVDNPTAQVFVDFGIKEGKILIVEHPRMEKVRRIGADLKATTVKQLRMSLFGEHLEHEVVVVFCAELSEGLQQIALAKTNEYSLAAPNNISKRTDVVIFNFLSVVQRLKEQGFLLKSVIRLHPKQNKRDILEIYDFDYISTGGESIEVCLASDIVVGMSSMILAEAYQLGKPVISVLPRLTEIEWMPVGIRKKIKICFSQEELSFALQAFLTEKASDLATTPPETVLDSNDDLLQFIECACNTVY